MSRPAKRPKPTWFDPAAWDLAALRRRYLAAKPFPHVVVDPLLGTNEHQTLAAALGREPHLYQQDEIFCFLGTAEPPVDPVLASFRERLSAPDMLAAIEAIDGRAVSSVSLRGYAYLPGHYLLPHGDHQDGLGRKMAFAYYVAHAGTLKGGELELFDCTMKGREVAKARPVKRIANRPNRLVLFGVDDRSLHQVREVRAGARLSLAGWFS